MYNGKIHKLTFENKQGQLIDQMCYANLSSSDVYELGLRNAKELSKKLKQKWKLIRVNQVR